MAGHVLTLGSACLEARPSGALWWAAERMLVVSDLHLGKSQRLARRGGVLLPPYETEATLLRLKAELDATKPACVICLGDSFDDLTAVTELAPTNRAHLVGMMKGVAWIWIEGNHDPAPVDLGGEHQASLLRDGVIFRHIADPDAQGPEISGHFHPKARLAGRTAPCFLYNPQSERLILPAFGAYTGGLACDAPALRPLMSGAGSLAILTGKVARAIPYSAASDSASPRAGAGIRPRSTSRSR